MEETKVDPVHEDLEEVLPVVVNQQIVDMELLVEEGRVVLAQEEDLEEALLGVEAKEDLVNLQALDMELQMEEIKMDLAQEEGIQDSVDMEIDPSY